MKSGIMVGAVERLFQKELDAARDEGIIIGEARSNERARQEERQAIRDRLIAGGIAPQEAARFTGLAV